MKIVNTEYNNKHEPIAVTIRCRRCGTEMRKNIPVDKDLRCVTCSRVPDLSDETKFNVTTSVDPRLNYSSRKQKLDKSMISKKEEF